MPYKPLDDTQRRTAAIRLLLRGKKYYEGNPQVLYALMQAKAHSDLSDYPSKNKILRQMIEARPEEFKIDSSDDNDVVGLTHTPSNFKIHTLKNTLQGLPELEKLPVPELAKAAQETLMNKRAYLEGYLTKQAGYTEDRQKQLGYSKDEMTAPYFDRRAHQAKLRAAGQAPALPGEARAMQVTNPVNTYAPSEVASVPGLQDKRDAFYENEKATDRARIDSELNAEMAARQKPEQDREAAMAAYKERMAQVSGRQTPVDAPIAQPVQEAPIQGNFEVAKKGGGSEAAIAAYNAKQQAGRTVVKGTPATGTKDQQAKAVAASPEYNKVVDTAGLKKVQDSRATADRQFASATQNIDNSAPRPMQVAKAPAKTQFKTDTISPRRGRGVI